MRSKGGRYVLQHRSHLTGVIAMGLTRVHLKMGLLISLLMLLIGHEINRLIDRNLKRAGVCIYHIILCKTRCCRGPHFPKLRIFRL